MNHGEKIKDILISDIWLSVYSNGNSDYISTEKTKDSQECYLGIFASVWSL